ncbi:GIY-YIG nuclease family protein [Chloroflexota bacterium]
MPYYVYVIELDREFARTPKAKNANPDADMNKACIYVGSSSKEPEVRFREHTEGARNDRGPLYSRVAYRYGVKLLPALYKRYNSMKTQSEAKAKEKELTRTYRKKGYTVWSN